MSSTKPTPEEADILEFLHGTLKAMSFLIAFFRKSLADERTLKDTGMTPLEVAETRLETIIRRLQDDPDVLDNGQRFHDLANQHLPRPGHEREGFISLLVSFQKEGGGSHEWLPPRLANLESELGQLRTHHRQVVNELTKLLARIEYLKSQRPAP